MRKHNPSLPDGEPVSTPEAPTARETAQPGLTRTEHELADGRYLLDYSRKPKPADA